MRIRSPIGWAIVALALFAIASPGCTPIRGGGNVGVASTTRQPGCAPNGAANFLDYDDGCCDGSTMYDGVRDLRVCCAASTNPMSFGSCR